MRLQDFPTLNIDLMYGLPDRTVATWLYSIREALQFQLTEIGVERSDAIGLWLFSETVCQLMQSYELT